MGKPLYVFVCYSVIVKFPEGKPVSIEAMKFNVDADGTVHDPSGRYQSCKKPILGKRKKHEWNKGLIFVDQKTGRKNFVRIPRDQCNYKMYMKFGSLSSDAPSITWIPKEFLEEGEAKTNEQRQLDKVMGFGDQRQKLVQDFGSKLDKRIYSHRETYGKNVIGLQSAEDFIPSTSDKPVFKKDYGTISSGLPCAPDLNSKNLSGIYPLKSFLVDRWNELKTYSPEGEEEFEAPTLFPDSIILELYETYCDARGEGELTDKIKRKVLETISTAEKTLSQASRKKPRGRKKKKSLPFVPDLIWHLMITTPWNIKGCPVSDEDGWILVEILFHLALMLQLFAQVDQKLLSKKWLTDSFFKPKRIAELKMIDKDSKMTGSREVQIRELSRKTTNGSFRKWVGVIARKSQKVQDVIYRCLLLVLHMFNFKIRSSDFQMISKALNLKHTHLFYSFEMLGCAVYRENLSKTPYSKDPSAIFIDFTKSDEDVVVELELENIYFGKKNQTRVRLKPNRATSIFEKL